MTGKLARINKASRMLFGKTGESKFMGSGDKKVQVNLAIDSRNTARKVKRGRGRRNIMLEKDCWHTQSTPLGGNQREETFLEVPFEVMAEAKRQAIRRWSLRGFPAVYSLNFDSVQVSCSST